MITEAQRKSSRLAIEELDEAVAAINAARSHLKAAGYEWRKLFAVQDQIDMIWYVVQRDLLRDRAAEEKIERQARDLVDACQSPACSSGCPCQCADLGGPAYELGYSKVLSLLKAKG